MVEPSSLLELAVDLARGAGALLRDERPEDLDVGTKSTPTDVVTAMDKATERLIVDGIRAARPDDGVLGEEGAARSGSSGVRWVVDPIDGTVNYLYRLPAYAVSIAAEVEGVVAAGVVLDVARGDLYAARAGGGATVNGRPIRCSAASELAQALVATGFGYDARRRAAQANLLVDVLPRIRDIRRFGAAALDLCFVARGWLDGYYEHGLSPWDLAAGALVAREAGAVVDGEPGGLVVAAAPRVFDPLRDLLRAAGADQLK